MATISLPAEDGIILMKIARLNDDKKSALFNSFKNYVKSLPESEWVEEISHITHFTKADSRSFLNIYMAILRSRNSFGYTVDEITDSIQYSLESEDKLDYYDESLLKPFLEKLFSINSKDLLIASNAYYSAVQTGNKLVTSMDASIDMKPTIYDEDVAFFTLTYALKLRSVDFKGDAVENFFSLDKADIDKLMSLLEKVKKQSEVLDSKYGDKIHYV